MQLLESGEPSAFQRRRRRRMTYRNSADQWVCETEGGSLESDGIT